MNFIEFTKSIDQRKIIDIQDVENYFNGIDRRRLYEWQKKNYLTKVVNNFYFISDIDIDENFLRSVANKIYYPSYVGLESALSYYNLIPDTVFQMTSVTTKRNRSIKTKIGDFKYRSIKNNLFFGYSLVETDRGAYYISDSEKTLLDIFYFTPDSDNNEFIEGMRFNLGEIRKIINPEKMTDYLKLFSSPKMDKAVRKLMKAANVKL